MATDFVMMILLAVAAVAAVAVLGHSPAAAQFSSGWVSVTKRLRALRQQGLLTQPDWREVRL